MSLSEKFDVCPCMTANLNSFVDYTFLLKGKLHLISGVSWLILVYANILYNLAIHHSLSSTNDNNGVLLRGGQAETAAKGKETTMLHDSKCGIAKN